MPRVIIYDGTNEEINEFLSYLSTTTYTDASKANERDVTSGNTSKTNSPDVIFSLIRSISIRLRETFTHA